MATVKALAKFFVLMSILGVCFRYLGGFSDAQSAVLAVVGALGYGLYAEMNAQRGVEKAFSPFRVSICPNWYQLLSDFKLIGSKEEWHRLREEAAKLPTSEYSVFRSGITFTVIQRASDVPLPGLTYWDNRKCFVTDLDFSEIIMPIESECPLDLDEKHPFFNHPKRSTLPRLYFRPGRGGYEIGLVVNDDWWENLCKEGESRELAKVKSITNRLGGSTRLAVVALPLSVFDLYYTNVDYDQTEKLRPAMDKQLEANGWKRKDEYDPEIRDPWSHVEHKYFSVSYREV
jgi:hypothetical protein